MFPFHSLHSLPVGSSMTVWPLPTALKHSPSKRRIPFRVRPPSNSDSAGSEQAVKAGGGSHEGAGSGSAGRVPVEGTTVVKDAGISSKNARLKV